MNSLGLEGALAGLRASQLGLYVTGKNLAGADVVGYVRRRVEVQTVGQDPVVNRLADPVLDARSRVENSRSAAAQAGAATLSGLEQVFDEPADTGLATALDKLWASFGDVAESGSAQGVLGTAGTVVDRLRQAAQSIDDANADAHTTLVGTVTTAAALASRLGEINKSITGLMAAGQDVSDLLDQRDQLTDQLAASIGATTTIATDGSATVTVGGATLVEGSTVTALAVGDDAQVTVGGAAVSLTGGSAAGNITAITTTLPAYRARLDTVAVSLRDTVNSALQAGYTADGAAGRPLFTGTGAGDIAVAITAPGDLAVTSAPGTTDRSVATTLSQAGLATDGPDARYRDLVSTLGAESARASANASALDAAAAAVDSARTSSEAVSVDEELASMLNYQHSYQSASRVLTTVDEMLDQLINHTGHVGL